MRKILALLILCLLSLSILPFAQAQNCLTSRLTVGGQAIVTPGSSNRIRSDASTSAEQIGQIPASGVFNLLEGPTCVDGFLWWRVEYNGTSGWTVEANSSDYFVDPVASNATQAPSGDGGTCSLAPRLRVNGLGRTSSNTPSRVRSAAGSSNNQVGQIDPIDTFLVLAGPVCVGGLNWWQVQRGNLTGWIAEGSGSDYFVELIANTATPTATRTSLPSSTPTASRTPTITPIPSITFTPSTTPSPTPSGFAEAYNLAWSADSSRLAVASSEGVFIYNAEDWSVYPQLLADIQSDSLAFNPTDSNILAVNSTSDDFLWRVYDISTGELVAEDSRISRAVDGIISATNLVFSEDGSTMAYAKELRVYLLDTESWTITRRLPLPLYEEPMLALAYVPDGLIGLEPTRNATGAYVFVFGENSRSELLDRGAHYDFNITAAAFSPDVQTVIVGDNSGSLQSWNINTLERTSFIRDETGVSQSNYINAIAYNPNGLELATAESDPQGLVRIFRADDLSLLENYGLNEGYQAAIDLAYSPDGSILAVIIDNYIHLLETEDYTLIQTLVQRP